MASKKILTYTDVNGNGEYRVLFCSGRVNPYHIYRVETTAAGGKIPRLIVAYADMASVFCWFAWYTQKHSTGTEAEVC